MTIPATYFEAKTYRLRDGEDPGANASWDVYKTGTGTTREDAAQAASMYLPLGYGGHGRSERTLEAIRAGETVATPLGTYRLEVEERPNLAAQDDRFDGLTHEEAQEVAEAAERRAAFEAASHSPLVEGQPGWGIRQQRDGHPLDGGWHFWVEMGRSLYGPFDTIEAARAELIAEANATTPEAIADELDDEPRQNPRAAIRQASARGDVELLTGFTAFAGGIVTEGDGVVVTFYPGKFDHQPEPTFGFVVWVTPDRDYATVEDVDGSRRHFPTSTAKTVALIGRRKP